MGFFACCRELHSEIRHVGEPKQIVENIAQVVTSPRKEAKIVISLNNKITKKGRGNKTLFKRMNFAFYFGCRVGLGVSAQTGMIMDIVKILQSRYSRIDFAVRFPECFEDLKGSDVEFESCVSNSI